MKKKLGLFGLIAVLALTSVGFVSGAWTQGFNTVGAISTGSYDVVFSSFTAPSPAYASSFSVYQVDSHTCAISLNDLYPGETSTFNFTLKATGTIPAILNDVKINGSSIVSGNSLITDYEYLYVDGSQDSQPDVTVNLDWVGTGDALPDIAANGGTLSGTLTIHTNGVSTADGNNAAANASGSFTFEIDTAQLP